MIYDNALDFPHFVTGEAVIECNLDRLQPELRLASISAHMNVHRFVAVETDKIEPIRAFPKSSRHGRTGSDVIILLDVIYTVPYRDLIQETIKAHRDVGCG